MKLLLVGTVPAGVCNVAIMTSVGSTVDGVAVQKLYSHTTKLLRWSRAASSQ